MAEHLFRKLIADAGLTGVEVRSAGISPAMGLALPVEAVAALAAEDVFDVHHRPSGLDRETVEWADLILAMERFHSDVIVTRFPDAAKRTEILKIFAGTAMDRDGITDPYGGTDADYCAVMAEIKTALLAIIRNWK